MKVNLLRDMVSKDAEILVEVNNRLNILGITKYKDCFVVSWYSKISNRDKHFVFDTLAKANYLFNTIMELQF